MLRTSEYWQTHHASTRSHSLRTDPHCVPGTLDCSSGVKRFDNPAHSDSAVAGKRWHLRPDVTHPCLGCRSLSGLCWPLRIHVTGASDKTGGFSSPLLTRFSPDIVRMWRQPGPSWADSSGFRGHPSKPSPNTATCVAAAIYCLIMWITFIQHSRRCQNWPWLPNHEITQLNPGLTTQLLQVTALII